MKNLKIELLLKHINDIFETYELNKDTDCVIIMNINRILIKPALKMILHKVLLIYAI